MAVAVVLQVLLTTTVEVLATENCCPALIFVNIVDTQVDTGRKFVGLGLDLVGCVTGITDGEGNLDDTTVHVGFTVTQVVDGEGRVADTCGLNLAAIVVVVCTEDGKTKEL